MLPFPHASFGRSDIGLAVPVGVGGRTPYNPSNVVVLPPSAQAGDFLAVNGGISGGASPVTTIGKLRYRHLVAADLVPGALTMSGSVVAWALYRGVYAAVSKSTGFAVGTVSLAGFTKSTKCAGLMALGNTPSPIGSGPSAAPAMFNRIVEHDNDSAAASIHDLLDHRSYVNGTALNVIGSTGFSQTTTAQLYELLF